MFLIGSLGLIAFPGTSGFFSKDEILFEAYANGRIGLYYAGLFGAFMTGLYTFRLIFIAFFGKAHHHGAHAPHARLSHDLPLAALAYWRCFGGFIHIPLDSVLPKHTRSPEAMEHQKHSLEAISVLVSLSGVALAWLIFGRSRDRAETCAVRATRSCAGGPRPSASTGCMTACS